MRGGKSGSRSQAGQRDGSASAALSLCRTFLETCFLPSVYKLCFTLSFQHSLVVCLRRALGFGARERSERVTARRQPHRQLRRRFV